MAFPKTIRHQLVQILDETRVKDDDLTLYSYSCDGLTIHTQLPMGVLFPKTAEEVSESVKLLSESNISFIPRGAGTGLSGGAVPIEESVIIEMFHFNEILEIDEKNRVMTAGPGVVNINLTQAVEGLGFQFVPDPSSQKACSLGGNVGENAGGPHTLKYGVTVNHVTGLEVVAPEGEILTLGGKTLGNPGPDLVGLFTGSEGTFGLVTKVFCRMTPLPEKIITLLAIYSDIEDASKTVSDIIEAGIVPAAMEMMDDLVIRALENSTKPGFPLDAAAVLIIEIEGMAEGLDFERDQIIKILENNKATSFKEAEDEEERNKIWSARKGAFAAIGSISPSYFTQDGVVPRAKLPYILKKIKQMGEENGLLIANVFHAGDGNLHPLVLYNAEKEGEQEKAFKLGKKILSECVKCGGSLTGEHGIGLEKNDMMPTLFSVDDLENFKNLKFAFDSKNLMNPGKVLPHPGKCSEMRIVSKKTGVAV